MEIVSLVFARNGLKWSVLCLANFLRKSHIWENSNSQDLFMKALDQSDRSIFQITIFWTVQLFFIIFCIKIEYHKTFKMTMSLFWSNAYLPPKRAKKSKSGQRSWTKATFLYIAQNWLIAFFWYSALSAYSALKSINCPRRHFSAKFSFSQKRGK